MYSIQVQEVPDDQGSNQKQQATICTRAVKGQATREYQSSANKYLVRPDSSSRRHLRNNVFSHSDEHGAEKGCKFRYHEKSSKLKLKTAVRGKATYYVSAA